MTKEKELSVEDIKKISGGNEPEEFEWRPQGMSTPIKIDDQVGWHFEAIQDQDSHVKKKTGDGKR